MRCIKCGSEIEADSRFCKDCGMKVMVVESASETQTVAETQNIQPEKLVTDNIEETKRKGFDKRLLVVPAAVVLLAAGIFSLFSLPKTVSGSKANNQTKVVYFKKDAMMLGDLKKEAKPVEVTDDWNQESFGISWVQYLSKDSSCIYYMEESKSGKRTLYKAPVSKLEDAVKIDTDVEYFIILSNNNVVYNKKESYYYHDGKSKLKFGKNVRGFVLDEAEKNVLWEEYVSGKDYYALYYQPLDQKTDKIKLEDEITSYYTDKTFKNIYVLKKETVSKIDISGNSEKIIKKVDSMVNGDPEKGIFYFIRETEKKLNLSDVISADKVERDIVDALSVKSVKIPVNELYYFADGEETLISDRVTASYFYPSNQGKYCLFQEFPEWESIEVPYSMITFADKSAEELGGTIVQYLSYETKNVRVAIKGSLPAAPGQFAAISFACFDEDSELLYFIGREDSDSEESTLYSVSNTGIFTEIDNEVDKIIAASGKGVYYFKDYEQDSGDLYFNGNYIMPDVYTAFYAKEADILVAHTDYNDADQCGTIVTYDGKNVVTVADDVAFVEAGQDGTLLMLSDYSMKRFRGDLLYYDKKDTRIIDDNVNGFAVRSGGYFQ